jgi:hypothetical protein
MQAAGTLAAEGIDAEVVDLRTVKPLDEEIVLESLAKTGRLVVVDTAWMKGGLCAEVGCLAAEKGFAHLKAPVARVGLPDVPTPAGYTLEQFFYPDAARIAAAARCVVRARPTSLQAPVGDRRSSTRLHVSWPPASSPWARRYAASSAPSPIASGSITRS